jgi:hypothetical protein
MGACNFSTTGFGKTVQEAYRNACDESQYESGHDSYNGTISTTRGFRLFSKEEHPRYGTKVFQKWENDIIENDKFGIEKWGKAGAVEIPRSYMLKKYPHMKGKRGKMFYFFGWAAE